VSEQHCDVLIVGGGPAGLASAIALRQRGADVLLADALAPPIDKACGEGIMPDSRRDLARLGVELPGDCGAQFHGIRFCDQRSSVSAEFPTGCGLGVRRTVLHQLLADRAAEAGVRLAWKNTILTRPGQPIALNGRPVHYRYLIGADGQSSRLRAWAGLDEGSVLTRRFGFRIHYRTASSVASQPIRHVEVHWARDGQAYVTPIAKNEICVAVVTRSADGVRTQAIIAGIPELQRRLAGAEIITSERGAITLTRRLKRVARGNVALVGDASGSADAISAGDMSLYQSGHPAIMRLPQAMAGIMLLMDRWPPLRRRALRALAHDPSLFETMLHVHLGEKPLRQFILTQAPALGLRLLLPSAA
jgi:flavin-dependent dehydrogenase